MRVLERDSQHAKVLQQLGWLYHQQDTSYASQDSAIVYLENSVKSGMFSDRSTLKFVALTNL